MVSKFIKFWFLLGNRNTKFFQTKATIRKRRNTIKKIKDAKGLGLKINRELPM